MTSVYLLCQKAGYAIAAAAIGAVLANVGYDETLGAANPENVLNAIQMMFCLVSENRFRAERCCNLLLSSETGCLQEDVHSAGE